MEARYAESSSGIDFVRAMIKLTMLRGQNKMGRVDGSVRIRDLWSGSIFIGWKIQ